MDAGERDAICVRPRYFGPGGTRYEEAIVDDLSKDTFEQ
jgi:hypothetical protein